MQPAGARDSQMAGRGTVPPAAAAMVALDGSRNRASPAVVQCVARCRCALHIPQLIVLKSTGSVFGFMVDLWLPWVHCAVLAAPEMVGGGGGEVGRRGERGKGRKQSIK